MEKDPPGVRPGRTARIAQAIGAAIGDALVQLKASDLNPHEGRLRGSAMDARFMGIPDSLPPDFGESPAPDK